MAGGDDDTASGPTVADRPGAKRAAEPPRPDDAASEPATIQVPSTGQQGVAPTSGPVRAASPRPTSRHGSVTLATTAADALRDEEIERTRLFIRMGWAISAAAIAGVPLLHAPRAMSVVFVAALAIGIAVSAWFHRAFADPRRYTGRAMLVLAMMCLVNAHVAVLYFGEFTITPLIVVIGIHFVARTEAERAARWIIATAIALYTAAALAIITGAIDDPGVFASDRPVPRRALIAGAVFVLGAYLLAYVTARSFRRASLRAIDSFQRATRLASQREALMDELRLDLERALRVGGPGRYTEQVVGPYKLGAVIGRGAMGEVYDAAHVTTGAPAAVKLVRRELLADPVHVARFLREVRASAALDSPHIARLLDASDRDPPYLAMERLHGETLAERLRREPRLPPPAIAALVRQAGAGLDAASAAGIVHRDVKPQNLFYATGGSAPRPAGGAVGVPTPRLTALDDGPGRIWKILDFGIATLARTERSRSIGLLPEAPALRSEGRAEYDELGGRMQYGLPAEDGATTLTHGGVVGTPSYMAPEQAEGQPLDGRADLYALAAVAYRCATGRHPFSAADTPALLYAVVHKMPPRPGDAAALPADVDAWFALALAKAPGDRFATGAALADALDDALAGALDPRLRRRADALLRKLPWGQS